MQHLQVTDDQGNVIGQEGRYDGSSHQAEIRNLQQLGLADLEVTRMIHSPDGWLLATVRPLEDTDGLIGSVTVGKLIDSKALAELNFDRTDPLLMVFDEAGEVVAASRAAHDDSGFVPVTPDGKMVAMAESGQVSQGTAYLGDNEHQTAYAPVILGDSSQGIFGVALNASPVVQLRDQLIANQVIVTAALVLLVLGVGYVVTRTITQRIVRLRDGAVEIGNGNLSVRVEENASDEMGTLAHEFNRMADNLSEKNSQLELANRNLEMRVFERTEELEQANAQLLDAQAQLVRTEKFAAVGELSAGVAHDLRNPLGAIRNGVFFLKGRLGRDEVDPKVREYLDVMDERITHCDNIIEDLISFTRIATPEYTLVSLSKALESAVWGMAMSDGMTIVKELPEEEDVEVQADHDQLVRVFSNLAMNAQDAMPSGGTLTISVKSVGQSAEVSFTDTGTGITPGDMEKIFDPLYTTKIQGTGLGLAVCQQIIAKHNGRTDVSSEEGVGATFTVRVPLRLGDQLPD